MNCIFGLSYYNIKPFKSNKRIHLDTSFDNPIVSLTFTNIESVIVKGICVAAFNNVTFTGIVNCSNCIGITCLQCRVGLQVDGLCTSVVGCTGLMQKPDLTTVCLSCSNEFNLVNGDCVCKNGKMISEHCSDELGCVSVAVVNSTVVCVSCDVSLKFKAKSVNGVCECIDGFKLEGNVCR